MNRKPTFHEELQRLMKEYAHEAYRMTRSFPKEERFGLCSQLRRASISVPLNYTEGFGRRKKKSYIHFLEISFGSLKESQYLLEFATEEQFIQKIEAQALMTKGSRIGGMLWALITKIEQDLSRSIV